MPGRGSSQPHQRHRELASEIFGADWSGGIASFIDGSFRDGAGDVVTILDPATEEPLATYADAGDA
ncbi:MAG: hypothetical protein AAFR23_06400, partial [Pseudomonadota bacterium]